MRNSLVGGVVALSVLLTAGCGGGGAGDASSKRLAASPTVPAMTLKEVCPQVEQALPQAMLPSAVRLGTFSDRLTELTDKGDLEAKNALGLLQAATVKFEVVADEQGQPLVEGSQGFVSAIRDFAKRCKAVGSSALQ